MRGAGYIDGVSVGLYDGASKGRRDRDFVGRHREGVCAVACGSCVDDATLGRLYGHRIGLISGVGHGRDSDFVTSRRPDQVNPDCAIGTGRSLDVIGKRLEGDCHIHIAGGHGKGECAIAQGSGNYTGTICPGDGHGCEFITRGGVAGHGDLCALRCSGMADLGHAMGDFSQSNSILHIRRFGGLENTSYSDALLGHRERILAVRGLYSVDDRAVDSHDGHAGELITRICRARNRHTAARGWRPQR